MLFHFCFCFGFCKFSNWKFKTFTVEEASAGGGMCCLALYLVIEHIDLFLLDRNLMLRLNMLLVDVIQFNRESNTAIRHRQVQVLSG